VAASEVAEDEVQHPQVREETHQLSNNNESPFELKFEIKHFGDKKSMGKNEKLKIKKTKI
jgi:hypothetical protein